MVKKIPVPCIRSADLHKIWVRWDGFIQAFMPWACLIKHEITCRVPVLLTGRFALLYC